MMEVKRYDHSLKQEWDDFVNTAKNGTFLFYRDYMDYHADRFDDYSLMLYLKNKLVSIFPLNRIGETVYSHLGLTFGGILVKANVNSITYIEYLNTYNNYLANKNIRKAIYKVIPQVYKTCFGDEEEYALYRLNAKRISCNLSSCIDLSMEININRNRKRSLKKSINIGLTTKKTLDWEGFWRIMENNLLEKFGVKPVHSINEIKILNNRFPNHIELIGAYLNDSLLAGAVLYKYNYNKIMKVQYAHASEEGKKLGAIDNLYHYMISQYSGLFHYIDFGTSNTNNGFFINTGLLNQKESFGARGVVFNTYEYNTDQNIKIDD